MNKILKQILTYLNKNKLIYIIIISTFLYTGYNVIFQNDTEKENIKIVNDIKDTYKHQIAITDFDNFYDSNKNRIYKITFPSQDYANYFEVLSRDPSTWKLDTTQVYKDINRTWASYRIDFSKYKKDLGVWLYNPTPVKSNLADYLSIFNVLLFTFFWLMILRMTGIAKPLNIKLFKPNENQKVSFDDIWWIESQKEEIVEVIDTLQNWDKFKEKGVRPLRGIMFFWPPGTGKTMVAKAIASATWIDLFISNGGDFRSKYLGEGAEKVHKSFKLVKQFIKQHEKNLWILFIDEIDTILKSRDSIHSEDATVVNAFLSEIDWIEGNSNIIIIGATNYQENIDEAILSRFDKKIHFDLPVFNERLDIIQKLIKRIEKKDPSVKIKNDLDLTVFCKNTQGLSGRDMENILNEVHNKQIQRDCIIDENLIQEIFSETILGKDRKGFTFTDEDKNIVAYHEIWHAVIWSLTWKKVHTVTIIPKGKALWLTWSVDKLEKILKTPEHFIYYIQELIAWRMAEQFFLWNITTWSSNDYERATLLAESYFRDYNFTYKNFQLGYIPKYQPWDIRNLELDKILKKEINILIKDQEKKVLKIFKTNEDKIKKLVSLIKEKEIIYEEDLNKILSEKIKFKKSLKKNSNTKI